MIRRYQSLLSKLYIVHDIVWGTLSLLAAWWIRFNTHLLPDYAHLSFTDYMSVLAVALPGFVIGAGFTGLYSATRTSRSIDLVIQVAKSVVFMALIVMSLLYFDKQVHYSRAVLMFFLIATWATVVMGRMMVRRILSAFRKRGFNRKYILLVGVTSATSRFLDQLHAHGELGYQVVGYLDLDHQFSQWVSESVGAFRETLDTVAATSERFDVGLVRERLLHHKIPCLGTLNQLGEMLSEHIVDHVVFTLPHEASSLLSPLIGTCESHGVHALLVPDFIDILPSKPKFEEFAGLPIIDTRYTPLDDAINSFAKRTFDLVFSTIILVLLSPVMALIALVIKASSPGPVIYRQERMGKNRRTFAMYKFRTMRHSPQLADTDQEADELWTVANDTRRTRIGAMLRSLSLDELPQFWNVLKGDMSVIGPRPERPFYVEQFRLDIPKYMVKHRVRPGITGWAQVNGLRGNTSIEDRIAYDLRYIEHWSFGWDLRIVMMTIFKGMRNKNAY